MSLKTGQKADVIHRPCKINGTFLRLDCINRQSFDSARSQFSTFLYRIAQNKTLNALKKKRPLFLSETPDVGSHHTAHNQMISKELHAELDRILDRLPTQQKLAFIWAEIEQLSHREIAQIEGVNIETK